MNKKRLFLVTLLLIVAVSLTGCVDAKFHLTINKDGSGDFSYKMLMDPTILAFSSQGNDASDKDPLTSMLEDAKKSGFTTTNLNENGKVGFEAVKHINNIEEDLNNGTLFGNSNIDKNFKPEEGLKIEKGFLQTTYKMKSDFDMSSMTASNESAEMNAMTQNMLRSMNFSFALTLPAKVKIHNASTTQDDGKTLVWNLIPGQHNEISMQADVLNTTNIALLVCGVLIILVAIITLIIFNRKKNYIPTTELKSNDNSISS